MKKFFLAERIIERFILHHTDNIRHKEKASQIKPDTVPPTLFQKTIN